MSQKLDVTMMPRESLKPYRGNPRRNEAAVGKVARSIQDFGFRQPIVVDSGMVIIAGHTRWEAARRIGLTEVPVHVAAGLTADQIAAYRLADNRTHDESEWDNDLLASELAGLRAADFDLASTGFDPVEIASLLADVVSAPGLDDDELPEAAQRVTTRDGDVWVLGKHRVHCGNSLNRPAVDAVLGGGQADICWTDPPYNVAYQGAAGKIQNDDQGDAQFRRFLTSAFLRIREALKPGGPVYIAHADTEGLSFRHAFIEAGLKLSGCLVWVKNGLVLWRSDYQWRHEPILYGWAPGAAHSWFGGRGQSTVVDLGDTSVQQVSDSEVRVTIGETVVTIRGQKIEVERGPGSVILEDKPKANPDHPTMKPVGLITRLLANSAESGAVVLDPFGGSGSPLIAAEKLGMAARLIELEPRFVDVIVRRWQEYARRDAVLESDGATFAATGEARRRAA